MIARVVPLRRFDSAHDWFDYRVPTEMKLQPGQLVTIPFLRQSLPGIVWELVENSQAARLRSVASIWRQDPVMTTQQMRNIKTISDQGFVSLGHLVVSTLPKYLNKDQSFPLPVQPKKPPRVSRLKLPTTLTWWYRNRNQAISWMVDWLTQPGSSRRVIIVPSIVDGQEMEQAVHQAGVEVPFIFGQMPVVSYRRIYESIRTGKITRMIGTSRACLLPFPTTPAVILDQEEHPAHKLSERHPRLDNRWLVHKIFSKPIVTTPAPSLSQYLRTNPIPPSIQSPRRIASLDRPKRQSWVSPELESLLDGNKIILLILPRGSAVRGLQCRTCGFSVPCQRCGQRLRWQNKGQSVITCRACGFDQSVRDHCPRCGGLDWSLVGLTLESFEVVIKRTWPTRNISTSWPPTSGSDTWLGTYQAYRWLTNTNSPDTMVIVSGDQLRAWSDFSADERAWQYLARLQAAVPTVPVLVQTSAPMDPFWQRWQASDDLAWYQDEIKVRKQLQTPPFVDQWILRYPGPDATQAASEITNWLSKHAPKIRFESLPATTGTWDANRRWLLSAAPGQTLADQIPSRIILPPPWQIDPWVTSWID